VLKMNRRPQQHCKIVESESNSLSYLVFLIAIECDFEEGVLWLHATRLVRQV
jgi:hypothetical protein